MNNDRNYILDRLKSRNVTVDEFNFDQLKAPPLSMFLSPFDIQELTSIATSVKLSGKPEERYKLIDNVMKRRGLIKFLSGTNRVTYRHPEFPDILFKVASDAVGMKDNPAEFRNQQFLKPFVTKIFEVSPGGVVAITERVNPITSREEYLTVADDVFEMINEWLVGEYVLADIGSKFFMNTGVRRGFGVVLLDFPYVYKLDGNKLYCNKPDYNSPTGKCDGIIDYDDGYNILHCTKCGAIYKAKELEVKIKNNEIINLDEGETKMKVKISGGSKNVNKKVKTADFDNENFGATMSHVLTGGISKKVETATKETTVVSNYDETSGYTFNVVKSRGKIPTAPVVKEIVKAEEPVIENKGNHSKPKKISPDVLFQSNETDSKGDRVPVTPKVVEVECRIENDKNNIEDSRSHEDFISNKDEVPLTVNGVNPFAKVAESPFTIDSDYQKECAIIEEKKDITETSPVRAIEIAINNINKALNNIPVDEIRDDAYANLLMAVTSMIPNSSRMFAMLISAARDIVDADIEGEVGPETSSILESLAREFCKFEDMYTDEINPVEEAMNNLGGDAVVDESEEEYVDEVPITDDSKITISDIKGIRTFGGKVVRLNELLPTQNSDQKLLVLTNEDGKYVGIDKYMIAVDEIDDIGFDDLEIISSEYISDLENYVNRLSKSDDDDKDISEEDANVDYNEATQQFLRDEETNKVEV